MALDKTLDILEEAGIKAPQQARSLASLVRMMRAARELLEERQGGDFSLSEVCQRGQLSNGSVFSRIRSREELLVAVQLQIIDEVAEDRDGVLAAAAAEAQDLREAIDRVIEGYAEVLARHIRSLRPITRLASTEPRLGEIGRKAHAEGEAAAVALLLRFRGEVAHADADAACLFGFRIVYAAIARRLALGNLDGAHESRDESFDQRESGDWDSFKRDLKGVMRAWLLSPAE